MDISEEYERYAMNQEMKHGGKIYVDRPRIDDNEYN
jgi:hypothetical protein